MSPVVLHGNLHPCPMNSWTFCLLTHDKHDESTLFVHFLYHYQRDVMYFISSENKKKTKLQWWHEKWIHIYTTKYITQKKTLHNAQEICIRTKQTFLFYHNCNQISNKHVCHFTQHAPPPLFFPFPTIHYFQIPCCIILRLSWSCSNSLRNICNRLVF